MRIAEAYFHRMLFETPAIEALSALSHKWQLRAREDAPGFGLALPEVDDILDREEGLRTRLSEFDRQLWSVPGIEESMLAYLREHESEILLPERALGRDAAS